MIEFLEIFFFGQGNVQMAVVDPIIGGALIAGGIQVIGGLFGAGQAKKRARAAQAEKDRLQRKLTNLENNRQDIINPYENISDLSSLATDLSGQMSNPFADLSVATQAAEMEIEQADISLANTLDTIRATGASAGGATALAQAALSSKKGVSASIEQQEAQNEKLRAQGEQQLEQQRVAEQRRLQGIQIGEGQRMQGLDAAGKQFMFGAQETRELQQLNRVSTQLGGAQAQQMQAQADQTGAYTSMVGGLAGIAGSTIGAMAEVRSSPWNADGTLKKTK
jgi:hypothetical protein